MSWCPKCEGNYPIVTSVKSSSYSVPVATERYNSYGEYIGYEESEAYLTHANTLPRCSNCYSVLKFPNITSKEEYFRTMQKILINKWRARKPSEPVSSPVGCALMGVVGGLLIGLIMYFVIKNSSLAIFIALIAAVGLGVYAFRSEKSDYPKMREKYEDEIKRWERKLNELQSMEYSDEHYEELIERMQAKRELTPKELKVLSVFSEERPMEKIHQRKKVNK